MRSVPPDAEIRRTAQPALLAACLLAGACAPPHDCTTEARGSVNLTVVDADGQALDGAVAVYSVDGAPAEPCDETPTGGWVCGWEVAGELAITASAPGYRTETATVRVAADECHVIPESLELVLDAVDCTDQEVPSVIVTVAGAEGEPLSGVAVTWSREVAAFPCDGPMEPSAGDPYWVCGWEEAGLLTVAAAADGHQTASETLMVEADECHVITEHVDLALQWGLD